MAAAIVPNEEWMRRAIGAARKGIAAGQSPFGAAIVRNGEMLAAGHNDVWARTDPTAHAEINAIRRAAARLGSINLSGCAIYSTCEPCPMCAAAIHWARFDAVIYGAAIADAASAGFHELRVPIVELYTRGESQVRIVNGFLAAECRELFTEWQARGGRAY